MNNSMTGEVKKNRYIVITIALVVFIGALFIFNSFVGGKFLTLSNFSLMVTAATVPTFVALGLTFIFASGITDFSVGAVVILAATMAGTLGNQFGYAGLIIGGVATGAILLFLNFQIYNWTRIPSWIAGLGMTMIYESVSAFYSNARLEKGMRVVMLESEYKALGMYPMVFLVLIIGLILAYILYNRTTIGLNLRAVGTNEEVARMMGIKAKKTLLLGGIIAGVFFGIAGFVKESYAGLVIAATGLSSISSIFQPLAAVLLSQVLQKNINIVIAVPISTIAITALFNMLTLVGVPSGTWQEVFLGVIVILFGILAQKNAKGVVK